VGFEVLATATGISAKSLMRMFGPNGNPQAQNLSEVFSVLQKQANLRVKVSTVRRGRAGSNAVRAGARVA